MNFELVPIKHLVHQFKLLSVKFGKYVQPQRLVVLAG